MSLIENIIRPDVRALAAYHVGASEGFVKLDAMENPYLLPEELRLELGRRLADVALNRYPIPSYSGLKAIIRDKMGVPAGFDVMLGNGSDELISLMSVACARRDLAAPVKVMAPVPTFVMYQMFAQFAGMEFAGVPLKADFSLDLPAMLAAIAQHKPAIVYLAYPNNPTGNLFAAEDIVAILRAVGDSGIVVVDEAYQPFSPTSFMPRLPEFPNLVVMRTVSKLGLAGVRLGYMSASAALLEQFEKVRPPYNVNVLTEAAVEFTLENVSVLDYQAALLRGEREQQAAALAALPGVEVFPSSANFLLLRVANAQRVFEKLIERKVLIRNVGKMHPLLTDCLRVNVSTPEENRQFLDAFKACIAE
ncbi:MAG: histidinol-phosphate transaminase [Burkholderiaceae bacterium]|nr:histidinol-phosphate transaminase [Burkholderiaceae bacterium]